MTDASVFKPHDDTRIHPIFVVVVLFVNFCCSFLVCLFVFWGQFLCIVLAVLELTMQNRLTSNRSACLCLPGIEIKVVSHGARLSISI